MLHRGIKFAYAIVMLASAALAFVIVRNFDEFAIQGPSYALTIGKSDNGAGPVQVGNLVQTFAQKHRVNVGRLYYDPLNDSNRLIYLAVGDSNTESTQWLAQGYPFFSRQAKLELRPYTEQVGIEPDGTYLIYGEESAAVLLEQEFRALNYTGELEPAFSARMAIQFVGRGAVPTCFLIIGLVAVVVVASAVALNAKSYGIQRLQGQSFFSILRRDLKQIAIFAGAAAGATGALTVLTLYAYNGLHQFGLYALYAIAIAATYVFAALLAHFATLALLHRSAILEAIKGEVTATWAIVGSYVLRGWGILLILSISTSAIVSGLTLNEEREKLLTWTALGNAYYMRINGGIEYLQSGKEIDNRIGQWIRDADTRNELPIASRQSLPGTPWDVLVVNNRYLLKHKIFGPNGTEIVPQDTITTRVLIPQRYSAESPKISAGVARWAELINPAVTEPRDVQTEETEDNQSLVVYTRSLETKELRIADPIVVVVTGASGVISNHEYVTMASNGEVLVEDPQRAIKGLTDAGVGAYILGMSPFAQDAANNYRDAKRNFSLEMFGLAAAVAVLLVTALAVSIVYCRRNTQALFVKYLHGWGFVRTHWRILAFEAAIGLVLVAWVWHRTAAVVSRHQLPGAPPMLPGELALGGWEPIVAGGVAVVSLALVTLILLRANGRFVKSHSASLS